MAGLGVPTRELPVLFGEHKSLVGILAEPAQAHSFVGRPAIVLLNAGIVHRVGPNRLYVFLARALAKAGYASLRFDMSGIGDSLMRAEALTPLASAMADIRAAVDWLAANKHIGRVILVGLCAGADHSVQYAPNDDRVIGVGLLDPSVPRTKRFRSNRVRTKLQRFVRKRPVEAVRSVTNFMRRELGQNNDGGEREAETDIDTDATLSDEELYRMFEPHYRGCARMGVHMLAVLTGGLQEQHNYREQLIDAFPQVDFAGTLSLDYIPQSDHTISRQEDREHLARTLIGWLDPIAERLSR